MNALIPVICALIGALVYLLSSPARSKYAELGRILFLASTFALMFAFAGKSIHLF